MSTTLFYFLNIYLQKAEKQATTGFLRSGIFPYYYWVSAVFGCDVLILLSFRRVYFDEILYCIVLYYICIMLYYMCIIVYVMKRWEIHERERKGHEKLQENCVRKKRTWKIVGKIHGKMYPLDENSQLPHRFQLNIS